VAEGLSLRYQPFHLWSAFRTIVALYCVVVSGYTVAKARDDGNVVSDGDLALSRTLEEYSKSFNRFERIKAIAKL